VIQPKIVLLGHVCIDKNEGEHASYTNWGSTVLYTANYFRRSLNIHPTVISSFGLDFEAYRSQFRLLPDHPTTSKTLLNGNFMRGKERVRTSRQLEGATPPELTSEISAALEDADVFILAPLLPNYDAAYVQSVLSHVRPNCVKGLSMQGYVRDVDVDGLIHPCDFAEAEEILPLFDVAVASEDDHPGIMALAHKWKQQSPKTNIIITQAANGASIIQNTGEENIPTTPVSPDEIVDSVGCGDIFLGTLAYWMSLGGELTNAIVAAHAAARAKLLTKR
jgi:sugar/nucleoside kinase (ribokinase family)